MWGHAFGLFLSERSAISFEEIIILLLCVPQSGVRKELNLK